MNTMNLNQESKDKFWKLYYSFCNSFNVQGWAKTQLNMLSSMLDPNEPHIKFPPSIEWIKDEVDRIKDSFLIINNELEDLKKLFLEEGNNSGE